MLVLGTVPSESIPWSVDALLQSSCVESLRICCPVTSHTGEVAVSSTSEMSRLIGSSWDCAWRGLARLEGLELSGSKGWEESNG
jgi:hypothetical protein